MDLREFSDMGRDIKDIVQDAVDTKNYQKLSQDITRAVNETFQNMNQKSPNGFYYQPKDEYGNPIYASERPKSSYEQMRDEQRAFRDQQRNLNRQRAANYRSSYNPNVANQQANRAETYGYMSNPNRNPQAQKQTASSNPNTKVVPKKNQEVYDVGFPAKSNPPGTVSGPLMMGLGYTFAGAFGIADLVLYTVGLAAQSSGTFITALAFTPVVIAGAILAGIGTKKHNFVKKYKDYLKILKGKKFSSFKEISSVTNKSISQTKKDMYKLIDKGYLPEGHIDNQETCVMLTNDIYDQYLATEENVRQQQEAQKDLTPDESSELDKVIEEGKRYMTRIREANDAIPDTEISNKLYRMEVIVKRIFDYVAKHPDQIPQLRRFMEYYMPTTDKLVTAYKEFDNQPIQGENIKTAKEEIAKTLDTINAAYEKLYDSMYVEAKMDVSSDIAVLRTLLAQEGLTENTFESKGEL